MTTYLFTIYVTKCEPGVQCHGQRTIHIEASVLKAGYYLLCEECERMGYLEWFVVYVFSESAGPLKVYTIRSEERYF